MQPVRADFAQQMSIPSHSTFCIWKDRLVELWDKDASEVFVGIGWFGGAIITIVEFAVKFFSFTEETPALLMSGLDVVITTSFFLEWAHKNKILDLISYGSELFNGLSSGGSLVREGIKSIQEIENMSSALTGWELEETYGLEENANASLRLVQGWLDFMTNLTFFGYSAFRLIGLILGLTIASPFLVDAFGLMCIGFMIASFVHSISFFDELEKPKIETILLSSHEI